jgi:hypothetical protein
MRLYCADILLRRYVSVRFSNYPMISLLLSSCQECCSVVQNQLQVLRVAEAEYYYGLPREHEQYLQLLELEASLESELVAWSSILELSGLRCSGIGHKSSPVKEIQVCAALRCSFGRYRSID